MRSMIAVAFCCLALWACAPAQKGPNVEEIGPGGNALLALVLKTLFQRQGYTIVDPQTRIGIGESKDPKEIQQSKKCVREGLRIQGYDATALVEALFAANAASPRLTLSSNKDEGYVVDYDGKFAKYFESDGGGWELLRTENPLAAGMTSVSLPVLDKKNGIVLVYIGTQWDWTAGGGGVLAFRLDKGELRQVAAVQMYIS